MAVHELQIPLAKPMLYLCVYRYGISLFVSGFNSTPEKEFSCTTTRQSILVFPAPT